MATMKKITFYTNFLRRSTKLVCLLACAVLCCASSAQEIDFQDKVAKPYIIAYNNRKYQFCPVDLNILKCEKIGQMFVLIAGITMVSYGAIRGEAATVLAKAIKLCLECVGIG